MDNRFDFLCDTMLHVTEVQENLEEIASQLRRRGFAHDRTKFQKTEFDAFVSTREKFKKANFGSKEYQECTDAVQLAVDHHYKYNRHHTGRWPNGIDDMSLIDIIEMLADWKAAERRSPDKQLIDTLDYAFKKYKIGGQLALIIKNTLKDLKWI